jgi:hypothetical protein
MATAETDGRLFEARQDGDTFRRLEQRWRQFLDRILEDPFIDPPRLPHLALLLLASLGRLCQQAEGQHGNESQV